MITYELIFMDYGNRGGGEIISTTWPFYLKGIVSQDKKVMYIKLTK
jgi:hypothetical protein